MAINLDKVRKQLNYELVYKFDGDEVFSIKPLIGEKKRFMDVMKSMKDDMESTLFTEWLCDLIKAANTEISDEDYNLIKTLIEEYQGDFVNQTIVGFKIRSQEEVDEQRVKLEEKFLEKNL